MTNQNFDVIIVGGGPAGLSAAIVCSRNGLRTLVLEKQRFPINKICGEGIMPTGVKNLEKLGIAPFILKQNYRPFHGIRYLSQGGKIAQSQFAEGSGWGVERLELSTALFKCTQQYSNLEIREGVVLKSKNLSLEKRGEVQINIENECLKAKLLLAADGLNSGVRRYLNVTKPGWQIKRWAARQHFEIKPWTDFVEVHWKYGLEAYVTPVSENKVGVAIVWDVKRFKPKAAGKEIMQSLIQEFPKLNAALAGALPTDSPMAIGPLHQRVRTPVAQGVILLGDAAGYLDAITGEGLSLATEQVLALEKLIIPELQKHGEVSEQVLQIYVAAYQKIVRPYYQVTHMALMLRHWPALTDRVVRCFAKETDIFQHMLSANMGLKTAWSMSPSQIVRLLKGVLLS